MLSLNSSQGKKQTKIVAYSPMPWIEHRGLHGQPSTLDRPPARL